MMSSSKMASQATPGRSSYLLLNRQEYAAIAAGATAGSLSAFVCSPIDVVRVRLQVHATLAGVAREQYSRISTAVANIWAQEGPKGFFRGYSTAAVIIPVFWGIYFPTYNAMKEAIGEKTGATPTSNAVRHGFAALGAAVVTDCITNPLWVVRTRLQTQALHRRPGEIEYRGTVHALRHIAKSEGVLSLWKGLTASLVGAVHAVIQFPLYEYLKLTAADHLGVKPTELTAVPLVLASVMSKLVASSIAYPHEVVRARLQDYRGPGRPGAFATFRNIAQHEGFRALYCGFSMNLFRTVPACAITFVTYEYVYGIVMGHKPLVQRRITIEDDDGVGGDFGSATD